MANVTVLGAGGATVTIALSSGENAAAAQTAVNFVNKLTTLGIVDQQTWSGSGTLPAPQNLLGGAIISTAGNAGALSAQYVSVVVNAAGKSTLVGPQNFNSTVVAGDSSNLSYGNLSQESQIFFGNGTNSLVNFQGKANLYATGGTYTVLTDSDASTSVHLAGDADLLISDMLGKLGSNTVDLASGANVTVQVTGSSTTAATINATSGSLFVGAYNQGSAVINPGAANVTVMSGLSTGIPLIGPAPLDNDLGGRVTLFGGSGSARVAYGQGVFTGGSAGKNSMFTSTVAGSATLTGGGNGDFLTAYGQGQVLIAGSGDSTLHGRHATGGSFTAGSGFTTVFGGGQGGNTFTFTGWGAAVVDGRDEEAFGAASKNTYINLDTDGGNPLGGTFFIGDFMTGVDKLQIALADDATITYFNPGAPGPMGATGGTEVIVSSGAKYYFYESKNGTLGQDIFDTDIQKV